MSDLVKPTPADLRRTADFFYDDHRSLANALRLAADALEAAEKTKQVDHLFARALINDLQAKLAIATEALECIAEHTVHHEPSLAAGRARKALAQINPQPTKPR